MLTIRKLTEQESEAWREGKRSVPAEFFDAMASAAVGDVFEIQCDDAVSARLCADLRKAARRQGRYITLRKASNRNVIVCSVESLIRQEWRGT